MLRLFKNVCCRDQKIKKTIHSLIGHDDPSVIWRCFIQPYDIAHNYSANRLRICHSLRFASAFLTGQYLQGPLIRFSVKILIQHCLKGKRLFYYIIRLYRFGSHSTAMPFAFCTAAFQIAIRTRCLCPDCCHISRTYFTHQKTGRKRYSCTVSLPVMRLMPLQLSVMNHTPLVSEHHYSSLIL